MDASLDPAVLVRQAREARGLSQRALALRAGTAQSVVARIEAGQSRPSVATLDRLLAAAGYRVAARLVPLASTLQERAQAYFAPLGPNGILASYLFGSTASGRRHRESDVDVGVLLDPNLFPDKAARSTQRVQISTDLIQVLGVNEVDVVILNDVPPGLGAKIVLDGIPLSIHDAEAAHAFTRDVQLKRADLEPFLRRMTRLKREALAR